MFSMFYSGRGRIRTPTSPLTTVLRSNYRNRRVLALITLYRGSVRALIMIWEGRNMI